jgi:SAM-dependent methyltransferase
VIARMSRVLRSRTAGKASPAPQQGPNADRGPGPAAPPRVVGMVEEFSRRLVVGWVSVPEDAPPTRVSLHLGKLKATSTYATPDAAMSGWRSATRGGAPADGDAPASTELVHPWQVPPIPGPADDRRNSRQQIRTFSFRIGGIWPYVKKGTRITVQVDAQPLPIHGHGMYLSPPRSGRHSVAELRRLFDEGYLLSQYGKVMLSKRVDTEWQRNVMALYRRTSDIVREAYGYDVFFIYGTLLGAVREGGYIGHDVDFDAAYVSKHRSGPDAAQELQDIALLLVKHGLDVQAMATALHIHDPEHPEHRIDLFHTFFDEEGLLRFPFGVAGTSSVHEDDWKGCEEIDFPGGRGLVPVAAEQVVELLYGADWRRPKPGFNWNLDRTDAASDGNLSTAMRTKVYWANFYSRTSYNSGSTFFDFVNGRQDTPRTVIDIGCGDGRDGCAFGAAGRTVLGLDQSPVGIEHATAHAEQLGVADRVRFEVCDVADVDDLGRALDRGAESSDEPIMFYMRFFLHAISEDVQDRLLAAIDAHARPGDYFAAEFRTDKDEATSHVHTKHYRRFQNAAEFSARLSGLRFDILHEEEGTGLSPYQGEDPVLYRVVARRPA